MTTRTHFYRHRMARRLTDAERDARIERVVRWAVGIAIAALFALGYWAAIEVVIFAGRAGL